MKACLGGVTVCCTNCTNLRPYSCTKITISVQLVQCTNLKLPTNGLFLNTLYHMPFFLFALYKVSHFYPLSPLSVFFYCSPLDSPFLNLCVNGYMLFVRDITFFVSFDFSVWIFTACLYQICALVCFVCIMWLLGIWSALPILCFIAGFSLRICIKAACQCVLAASCGS